MDADEIRSLRDELGLTRQELASRLQVPVSRVASWETGKAGLGSDIRARLLRLKRLKDFQGSGRWLSLADLVEEEGSHSPEDLPPWHPESACVEDGHLSIIVSPPRCGKTLTALRWALEVVHMHGVPVYYLSTHWTPLQTLRHLERALPDGVPFDPSLPFYLFQHDGMDLSGMLEEVGTRIGEESHAFVVVDWLQNLEIQGKDFPDLESKERQLLRDLKLWASHLGVYVLVIASQRGVSVCEPGSFPHFFELADSISLGSLRDLHQRRAEYKFQDLHRGRRELFEVELPGVDELGRIRRKAVEREWHAKRNRRGFRRGDLTDG